MQAIKPSKTMYFLAFLSLLPLLLSLFLALYFWLDWAQYTGITLHWARLNAYIYAHSYSALLLSLFAGIHIGQALNEQNNRWYLIINGALFALAWFSFKSFADVDGMVFLIFCWVASWLLEFNSLQNGTGKALGKLLFKLKLIIILILVLLVLISG